MTNITDTNQLASLQQLIWIYTVYKGRAYPGTAEPGLFKIAQGKRGVSTCFFFFIFPGNHMLLVLMRSTHNICFLKDIRKNISIF